MSVDPQYFLHESLLTLHEAARRLPPARRGRPVSFSCVLRWITDGVPGPDGHRVKLEGVRVGGRWLTSVEALARWAARLTPRLDDARPMTPRAAAQRNRAADRAAQALDRLGI